MTASNEDGLPFSTGGPAPASAFPDIPSVVTAGERRVEIRYLPAEESVLRTLAAWLHAEWGHIDDYASVEERMDSLRDHLDSRSLPLTVVACEDGEPVGTASLLRHDMDDRPQWTPWLGNVYVRPDLRGEGLATALCARIVAEARRLGYRVLYLYTADAEGLYAGMGWEVVERRAYWSEPAVVVMRLRLQAAATGNGSAGGGRNGGSEGLPVAAADGSRRG